MKKCDFLALAFVFPRKPNLNTTLPIISCMRWMNLLKKLALALVAFIAAFYFIALFKAWAEKQGGRFLFIGDFESWALILIVALAVIKVLEWLLKWEIHTLFFQKRPAIPKRGGRK